MKMFDLISNFPEQLMDAFEIGKNANLSPTELPVQNVVISGLGGSGIGGSIAALLVEKEAGVPIQVNNKYFLPGYTGPQTLVIISSYSGNTEETVNCLEEAIRKGAQIVCVTSGGMVADLAAENGLDLIEIPGGMPPRACLGYSLTQLFFILAFHKIIDNTFKAKINAAIELISEHKGALMLEAKAIAAKLKNKIPIIYSVASTEAVGIRLRQQLNENAKVLAWHHVFPEMNHNELVGWREKNENLAIIILRNERDYSRNKQRIEISKGIFSRYTSTIIELYSKGGSDIENAIYLIHLGDWVSLFLAEIRGVDPVEVDVIDYLKGELSKTQ